MMPRTANEVLFQQGVFLPGQAAEFLNYIIDSRRDDLKKYAQRSNANEAYLEKENRHLEMLFRLLQAITQLHYDNIWLEVERQWEMAKAKDSSLKGINAIITLNPDGNMYFMTRLP